VTSLRAFRLTSQDVRRYDSPIVYASPTFQALTGYDLPQILGRNCRFLQSERLSFVYQSSSHAGPDGEVVKGSKRKYTDNVAVAHLKRMLNAGKECQASLINYRRGGIPFINLVTVVPIPWDGTDIVYHVGFQVDLVEQPNAILRNMRDGSYQVNYTVTNPPQPMLRPPGREGGLGLSQDIVDILGPRVNQPGFGMGEEGGKMEWLKMVLENADGTSDVSSVADLQTLSTFYRSRACSNTSHRQFDGFLSTSRRICSTRISATYATRPISCRSCESSRTRPMHR